LEEENYNKYVENFAKSFINTVLTPYTLNEYLKNLNMNPSVPTRDNIETMISDPKNNEQNLIRLSQYYYNTQTPYKRLVHYYGKLLSFDYTIYPINAEEKDMKKDTYKKDLDRVYSWFDRFKVKKEFKKALSKTVLEDVYFTYLRESNAGLTLQEMPVDYSKITTWSEYGYLYDFDLTYFQNSGVNIDGFAPEFKNYFNQMLDIKKNNKYYPDIKPETRNGRWVYWQQIPIDKGWVFKFNNIYAGIIPPLIGLFLDNIDIDTYKKLQLTKTSLEASMLLFGLIPRHKDGSNRSGNSKDDFALSAENAGQFMSLIRGNLPDGVKFNAVPFEDIQSVNFPNTQNRNDIVGRAMQQYYYNSGTSQFLFASDKANAVTSKASIKVDEEFIRDSYYQYESFVNYHLSKITNRYKFVCKFEGTMFDQDERFERANKYAENGMALPELGSAIGLEPKEFQTKLAMMRSMDFVDKLKVLQTSYTISKSQQDDKGRPSKKIDDLDDEGLNTRNSGSNEGRDE
jgi:hypothetical protein